MKAVKVFSFILFTSAALIVLIILLLFSFHKDNTTKAIVPPAIKVTPRITLTKSLFSTDIKNIITELLGPDDGTYSILVENMQTHEGYSQNPDRIYESASLYKLWVMAGVYQQLDSGKLEKNKLLSDSVEDLNKSFNIATKDAELTTGEIHATVNDALTNAITFSDNYSALLLTKALGLNSLSTFLKDQQFTSSKIGTPPTTSATDIALFYIKLYNHELINDQSSEEMINILKRQAINDRIPKYLPEEINVAHKTGELDDFKHDAGIVYTPKGDYILVMLSQTKDPQKAAEKMAEISKQIYIYFSSLN